MKWLLVVLSLGGMLGLSTLSFGDTPKRRYIYPERTEIDLDALEVDGELKRPGEFYFQQREPERFSTLVERRKNFHRQMLRDVVKGH